MTLTPERITELRQPALLLSSPQRRPERRGWKLMDDLLTLAAEIARGEYHPSHCVEDYRKGTGRETFAEMAGDYADRLRGRVVVLRKANDRIAALEAQLVEARGVMEKEARDPITPLVFIDAYLAKHPEDDSDV